MTPDCRGQIAPPHAAAVDHMFGHDRAGGTGPCRYRSTPVTCSPSSVTAFTFTPSKILAPLHPRPFGQRHGDVRRIALAIARQADRADDIFGR